MASQRDHAPAISRQAVDRARGCAAVYRSLKQSFVVASNAQAGAAPVTMSYGVPGGSPARHIVYDAPEAGDGTSAVTAAAASDRCLVRITAGSGAALPDTRSCSRSGQRAMAARSHKIPRSRPERPLRAAAASLENPAAAVAAMSQPAGARHRGCFCWPGSHCLDWLSSRGVGARVFMSDGPRHS